MSADRVKEPLNILILEDRDDVVELLLHGLRRAGIEVVWRRAESRESFVENLHPELDIILADYSLPQFDALEALKLLSEQGLDIPLIIVSGTIGEEAAVEGLKHGAVDYLLKDRLGRLEGAIRGALRQRALRSQRQEAIKALRQSELRYRKMVEDSLQGIAVVQDGRTVFTNNAYAAIMGYAVEELLSMTPQEMQALVHPEDRGRLLEYHRRRMAGEPAPSRYEFRVFRRDGAVRWLDAVVSDTSYRGRRAAQAYYVDITERKQAEEAAREQRARERVEQILDAIGEGVVVLDQQGCVQQVNPAFVQQTGYTDEEIIGASYQELWTEGTNGDAGFLKTVLAELAHVSSWRGQATVRRRNGSIYDAAMTVTQLHDERGGEGEFVISIRDISQMKEVERMKDSIISIAAHELRTPLTTISLYSEALASRQVSSEQRARYVEAIFEQTQHLTKIIDDMLDLARLEAGRGLEISSEPVDVAALVQEVVRPFADLQLQHDFVLQGLHAAKSVQGDPLRLAQVLRNIVSNAVKYSPHGGPIIVDAQNKPGFVQISITDHGVGMTPDQQTHLFEKFYRANSSGSGPGGTGLGLAISRLIVEGHGGRIWASSELGVGSTFTFTIPTVERPPASP